MKFGFLFSDLDKTNYTGQPLVAYQLVQCALAQGHRVVIVSNVSSDDNLPDPSEGVEVFLVRGAGSFATYLVNLPRIFLFLKSQKLDCLFVHGALFAVGMRPLAALLGIPMMVSCCEIIDMHPPVLQKLIAKCFSASSEGFVTSEVIRAQLLKRGVSEKKIKVVPLGVRTDFFSTSVNSLSITPTDVLFWGDSKLDRGFDIIVRLAEALPQLNFRVLLRWRGNDCTEELERFCELPNTEVLNYPYSVPLTSYIHTTKIVVLPFRFMGVRPPISLLEAMAMGRCVLTTPMAGNDEIIQNNERGFIIDFEHGWDAALTLIVQLIKDKAYRDKIGYAAHIYTKQRYGDPEALGLLMNNENLESVCID